MTLIRPFKGLRPTVENATDVVAPPYDVLNTAEAKNRVVGRPYSFLHISKPEIDLPDGTDPFDASVYQKGAENLANLIEKGILIREEKSVYYAYRIIMGEHQQIGLVAAASVAEYDKNRIRKHEFTRPDKEDDRVRQIDALNAQTGPVFITYRHESSVDDIIKKATTQPHLYDIVADDNVRHTIWLIDSDADIASLTSSFDSMKCIYIADGHHRSAAASRVSAMRNKDSGGNNDSMHDYFLTVMFPDNQMQILDYNRVVKDLNGLSAQEFVDAVAKDFTVTKSQNAVKPANAGQFGLYLDKQWYQLDINADCIPNDDPVGRLDVSMLQNNLITPILNIDDPRRDKRIDFVGGIRGLAELEKRVDSGEMAAAFALYPTQLSDLMAVADAEKVMPPKSTWFEPKLADGLVSHVLD